MRAIPLLPLRSSVVLPGETAVVPVGRPASLAAVEAAAQGDGWVFVCLQRDPDCEAPGSEDLQPVGCVAVVAGGAESAGGVRRVPVTGIGRATLDGFVASGPPAAASPSGAQLVRVRPLQWRWPAAGGSEPLPPDPSPAPPGDALVMAAWLHRELQSGPAARSLPKAPGPAAPGPWADAVAAALVRGAADKQGVLACDDVQERLRILHRCVSAHLRAGGDEAERDVVREMAAAQREYRLRAQLQAIRRQLGDPEDASAEAAAWERRIADAALPPAAAAAAREEARRLARLPPGGSEASVVRTYLEWLAAMPWSRVTAERLDLDAASQVLDRDHHGLEAVKRRILEHLATHILRARSRGDLPPAGPGGGGVLCFVGPPGTGKTSLGRSIAEALDRPFVHVSLGGVHDEAEIRGHRRTYVGAMPGRIIAGVRAAGARNPVMLLDEIDKVGGQGQGDPAAALLEVLDPSQHARFTDHYLDVPFDLGEVMFLASANGVETMARPLLDRLEVVECPGYGADDKIEIARRHLVPRALAQHALPAGALSVTTAALRRIADEYALDAGVRGMQREIAAICRAAAAQVVADPGTHLRVGGSDVARWLGPPARRRRPAARPEVGAALGVAVGGAGGELVAVEASAVPGHGGFEVAGDPRLIRQDAMSAVRTYLRARCDDLGGRERFAAVDLHVHMRLSDKGAEAAWVDGRGMGLPVLIAAASALTRRSPAAGWAAAADVTSHGGVGSAGALLARALAVRAGRAGTLVLAEDDREAWAALPERLREQLPVLFVERAEEAIRAALGG